MASERSPVDMIDEILNHEDKLTTWECEFIDSLSDRDLENLTDNQQEKLAQIYRRYCKE